jgi:hypothetical protein
MPVGLININMNSPSKSSMSSGCVWFPTNTVRICNSYSSASSLTMAAPFSLRKEFGLSIKFEELVLLVT